MPPADDKHSQGGSSKGGSTTGSAAASSMGTTKGVAAVLQRGVLFPIVNQAELLVDWKLSAFGLLVELLQLVGLVFNSQYAWGPTFGESIAKVVYFFDMPLFDSQWASNASTAANVFFWLVIVCHVFLAAILIIGLTSEHQLFSKGSFVSWVTHSFATFLFLPSVLILMSFMVCDSERVNLNWDTSTSCSGVFANVYFAVGVIGLVMLSTTAYVSTGALFDDAPNTQCILARSQTSTAERYLALKLAAGIAYHVLLSKGLHHVFATAFTAVCILHAVEYAFFLPYYRLWVNRYRCGSLLVVATFAGVASSEAAVTSSWNSNSTSTIVVLCVSVALFAVGWLLPQLRINANYRRAAADLHEGKLMRFSEPTYPGGLPKNDLAFSAIKNIESVFVSHHRQAAMGGVSSEMEDDDEEPITILVPYLSSVSVNTDVEVSTRFLVEHFDNCGSQPTDKMRGFAARIFLKGIARFRRDPLLTYQFAQFLAIFGRKNRMALTEIENVGKYEPTFVLSYRAFKSQIKLKASLNMSDTTHIKLLNSTLRLHKEILGHMSTFWMKLLSPNVDTVQLAAIANTITARREQAATMFRRVLITPNQNILLKYARFLEQVMLDSVTARLITDRVAEQAEQKRQEMLAANQHGGSREQKAESEIANEHADLMNKIDEATTQDAAAAGSGTGQSSTIDTLSNMVHVLFFILMLLGVGFIIYHVVLDTTAKNGIKRMQAAGRCRYLTTMGGYYTSEIYQEWSKGASADASKIAAWQSALVNITSEFFSKHSDLTQGSLTSNFGPLVSFLKGSRTEIYQPDATGKSLSGGYTRTLVDLFNLGFSIAAAMTTIASASSISSVSNSTFQYIILNARTNFPSAYNRSMYYYEMETTQAMNTNFWVVTGLFAASAVLVFIIYSTMVLNFQKIGASKLLTLSLFTLIPRLYLEQLHSSSKEKLETFDVDDQQDQVDDMHSLTLESGSARGGPGAAQKKPSEVSAQVRKQTSTAAAAATAKRNASLTVDAIKKDNKEEEDSKDDASEFSEAEPDEGEKSDSSKTMNSVLRTILYILLLTGLLVVVLSLSVAAFVMVYELQDITIQNRFRRENAVLSNDLQAQYYDAIIRLSDEARLYVASGSIENLVQYYNIWSSSKMEKLHRDALYDTSMVASQTSLSALVSMQTLVDDLLRRQQVAIWLASQAYVVSSDQQYLVDRILSTRVYNFATLQSVYATMFATFAITSPPAQSTDQTTDAALNATMKLLTAKSLIFDDIYEAHFPTIERLRANVFDSAQSDINSATDDFKSYCGAALGLYAGCFLFFIALIRVYNTQVAGATALQRGSLFVGVVVVIVNIIVIAILLTSTEGLKEAFASKMDYQTSKNTSFSSLRFQSAFALSYAEFGQKQRYHSYVEQNGLTTWEASLNTLLHALIRSIGNDAADAPNLVKSIIDIRLRGEELFSLDETSLWLTTSGYGYDASASEFSYLTGFVYSRSRERGYAADVARFGLGSPMYTNNTFDAAESLPTQISIAQATVSNPRFVSHKSNVLSAIETVFRTAQQHIDDALDSKESSTTSLSTATLALSVIILLLMVLTGMYASFSAVNDMSNTARSGAVGSGEREQLFEDLTDRSRVALILVSILLCAAYGYDIYVTKAASSIAHNLNLASTREWSIAQTMMEVRRVFDDAAASNSLSAASPYGAELMDFVRRIQHDRDAFYLGNSSQFPMSFNAITKDSTLLFGSNAYQSLQYQTDCSSFQSQSFVTAADFNVSSPTASMYTALFQDGVEAVVLQWLMLLGNVARAKSVSEAAQYQTILRNLVQPLADQLSTATSNYHDTMSTFISTLGSAHYAIVAALIALVVILLLIVFRPMVNMLLNEERGTKLLLRMIPPNVRQNVPAISEYLETGSITQNEKMQRINEVVTEMSVVSLFVIDWSGTILRASPAARDEFGYENDELIGQNVKVLMPDEIARHHDEYLQNYRQTGESRVIDRPIRQVGKRKDGSVFPLELMVREFRKSSSDSTFLGFARNISADLEYEKVTKLNEAVSDMSQIPVIVIDAVGTIRRINRAVIHTFGYQSQELMNKNIKLLMPTRISINHDQYLDAYQKTRKKTIIDSSRKVMGLRKNGEEFPIEVTVKEMLNERGKTQFFIGYAKDITQDLLFTQSVMANEAVIQISPAPVISISSQGILLVFSPAAELSWGYRAEEVLGKNIRMLMTEEDAMRHDGYLARYMKTGEKHIVDNTRTVKAKRKDGSVFFAEANIKELRKGDHVSFIGYLKDMTQEYEIAHKNRVNKTVFSASPVPIVVIDEIGTVLQFNPSAEKQMGYRADQVINQNVKMLMPDVVAENHDSYLQRYRETGIKTIIDSKRRAHAKKADGRSMAVEISVKEVVVEDLLSETGQKRLFVGYIRDITEEFQMMKANILNDAITNLCTIPMISITKTGTIITFSLAAEKQFGYKYEEVSGKNIKMLMPQRIAEKHDFFLKRYAETGEKHVIDTTRLAVGLTSTGQEFPAEIAVKEIRKSGLEPIYVGYVRNVKEEIEVEDARLLVDTIVNVSPVPVVVINTKGVVQKFSSEAQHVFGWKAEEIIGKNVKLLMPQEVARNHDNYLRAYLRTGVKTIIDGVRTVQAIRKDGLQLSVEVMVRELKKEGGAQESIFVGFLRDMSQEYILRQSNELKDVILNESSIPMIQIDPLGTILFANPALLQEFRYEEEELLGANVKILTPPEIAKHHDSYLSNYLTTGVKHVIDTVREVTAIRKDGVRLPVNISVRELVSDGKRTYFGYMRNMTQSLQIRDQKLLGDVIIDLSMIPLVIIDEVGTVLAFNRAASETFRYSQEEVVGQNIKMLQTAEVAAVHDQYLSNYKQHRVKSVIDTTRRVLGRKKNGFTFPVEITVKEMYDPVEQRSTYVGYLRNITDEFRLNLANEIADAVSAMSPIPLIAINTKGIITKFSRAAELELEYTAEEIIGQNIKILQPDEIAVEHDGYLARYLETGVKRVIDTSRHVRAKKRSGETFPAEITVREINLDGADRTFIGFLRNLTQENLDDASSRINTKVMGMMMTPLVVINEQGVIEEANAALRDTFGYDADDLIGSNVNCLMPDEIAEKHDGYLSRYLQTGIKRVLADKRVVTAKHRDGSLFPIEVHVKELFSKELNRRSYFGFLRDIRQDLELKYAFDLNDAITDMIKAPIIAIDQSGTIIKFSRAACNVFGYEMSEIVGRNVSTLMPEPYASGHDGYLSNYQVTRKKTVVDSVRRVPAKRKNGTVVTVELRVGEFAKAGGSSTFVAFLRDVAESDALERERQTSMQISALSQLAVVIADKRGFIQSVNPATCTLFRYKEEELVGQNVKMLMPKSLAVHHDNYLEAYQRTKVKHVIDTSRRSQGIKRGEVTFDLEIGVRELELVGVGTRYLGFIRDISAEVVLEEAHKISGSIVALSPVPIIVMDSLGIVMQFPDLATTMLGYSRDEVIGRNIKMLMPPHVANEHDAYLQRYTTTRVKHVIDSTRQSTAQRKDGTVVDIEISVKEVRGDDGSIYFAGFIKPLGDLFSALQLKSSADAVKPRK